MYNCGQRVSLRLDYVTSDYVSCSESRCFQYNHVFVGAHMLSRSRKSVREVYVEAGKLESIYPV